LGYHLIFIHLNKNLSKNKNFTNKELGYHLIFIHLNKNLSKNKNFTNKEIWDFQSAPLIADGKIGDWNGDEKHCGYKENCKLILLLLLLLLLLQKRRLC